MINENYWADWKNDIDYLFGRWMDLKDWEDIIFFYMLLYISIHYRWYESYEDI